MWIQMTNENFTVIICFAFLFHLQLTGVDHPKMLASASVRCIPGRTTPTNCFEFRVSRDCTSNPKTTQLNARIQGLQVLQKERKRTERRKRKAKKEKNRKKKQRQRKEKKTKKAKKQKQKNEKKEKGRGKFTLNPVSIDTLGW